MEWHNTPGEAAGNTREPGLSVQPSGTDGKHVRRWTSMDHKDRRLCAGGDRAGRPWSPGEEERKCVQRGKESADKCKKARQKSCSRCVTQRKYTVPGRGSDCPSPVTTIPWSPNPRRFRMWPYWGGRGLLTNEITGWALIQCDDCLPKKGRWGQAQAEGRLWEGTERWPSADQEERSQRQATLPIFLF